MVYATNDAWGALVVLGWLLSPLTIIVGAVGVAVLVDFGRRSARRVFQRRHALPATPVDAG